MQRRVRELLADPSSPRSTSARLGPAHTPKTSPGDDDTWVPRDSIQG